MVQCKQITQFSLSGVEVVFLLVLSKRNAICLGWFVYVVCYSCVDTHFITGREINVGFSKGQGRSTVFSSTLKVVEEKMGSFFTRMHSDRTRGNRNKLLQEQLCLG